MRAVLHTSFTSPARVVPASNVYTLISLGKNSHVINDQCVLSSSICTQCVCGMRYDAACNNSSDSFTVPFVRLVAFRTRMIIHINVGSNGGVQSYKWLCMHVVQANASDSKAHTHTHRCVMSHRLNRKYRLKLCPMPVHHFIIIIDWNACTWNCNISRRRKKRSNPNSATRKMCSTQPMNATHNWQISRRRTRSRHSRCSAPREEFSIYILFTLLAGLQ